MTFFRPSRSALISRVEADLATRLGIGALIRRSILKAWAAVVAGLSHGLHGHADHLTRQILPDTADTENLERWGAIFGISRKSAAFATGNVTFTGTEASNIPIGTVVQRADGVRYETTATATIASGTASAPVLAQTAAEIGNADAAQALALSSPVSGIDTTATVAAGGLTGGVDREEDADLLVRVSSRLQDPPQGGSSADYVGWCLEVAGVTRAWTLPLFQGPGTVGVTFVLDESGTIIPSAAKVQEVADYLAPLRPVTATLTVFAPGESSLAITVALTPDNASVRAAVEASLEDMLRNETEPGKVLPLSKIAEAISAAEGEESHVLAVPTSDHTPTAGEIVVLGTMIYT